MAKRVLFLCSRNRLRSPSAELVAWADLIFVMEKSHRRKLARGFGRHVTARVVCLDIPDDHDFMAPALVALLRARVPRHLG